MNKSKLELLPCRSIKEFLRWSKNLPFLMSRVRSMAWGIWRFVRQDEFSQFYRQIRSHTMCPNMHLYGLYRAIKKAENENIPGDIVECGTAYGGSAALMGLALKASNANRTLWVFDTFEGIPAPTNNDPDLDIAKHYTGAFRGEFTEVRSLFSRLGILSNIKMVKGLFQDTLPIAEVNNIALLHIDGDWYDSVMTCLEYFYDRVGIGGIIQIDDYGYWEGARKAVDDFMSLYDLNDELIVIDYEGRQWIKSKNRDVGG